jgi:hypothetical protein
MNSPLPLHLTEGALIVDNSMLECLHTCPRLFEYKYLFRRILKGRHAALDFGSAIHTALEYRYKTCGSDQPTLADEEAMIDVINAFYAEHPVLDEEEHRNAAFASDIIRYYNSKYRNEPFRLLQDSNGKILAELSFSLPLFTWSGLLPQINPNVPWDGTFYEAEIPVIFAGRIDLPIRYGSDNLVLDTKTGSMMFGPAAFVREHSATNQFKGYGWAFEKLTGLTCHGAMLNGIVSKRAPAKPKSGTVEDWYHDWMPRDIFYFNTNPDWRTDWEHDTILSVNLLFYYYTRQFFPMSGLYTRACTKYGGCDFADVCTQPKGQRPMLIQDNRIYEDNKWSPLKD